MLELQAPDGLAELYEFEPEQQQYRLLGTTALHESVERTYSPAPLPEGFEFAVAGSIDTAELTELMQSVSIGSDMTEREIIEAHEDFDKDGVTSIEIGIREQTTNKLVGYGGLIVDPNGDGEMGDFVVDPKFQSMGIGKAIIDQRLLQAESLGVNTLRIPQIEPTNTLMAYYLKRGFRLQEDGTLLKHLKASNQPH